MKLLPLFPVLGVLLPSSLSAALSVQFSVQRTVQDSYFSRWMVPVEDFIDQAPELDWAYTNHGNPTGAPRIGGCEMTIQLEDGETILEAWADLSEGPRADPIWPGTWNVTSSLWENPFENGDTIAPLYFHLVTTKGDYSQQFHFIPEPSSAALAALGGSMLFRRGRK